MFSLFSKSQPYILSCEHVVIYAYLMQTVRNYKIRDKTKIRYLISEMSIFTLNFQLCTDRHHKNCINLKKKIFDSYHEKWEANAVAYEPRTVIIVILKSLPFHYNKLVTIMNLIVELLDRIPIYEAIWSISIEHLDDF